MNPLAALEASLRDARVGTCTKLERVPRPTLLGLPSAFFNRISYTSGGFASPILNIRLRLAWRGSSLTAADCRN
jgi:hypothetical protein